jgi:hypothetical protein
MLLALAVLASAAVACAIPVPMAPPYAMGPSGVSPIPPAPRVPDNVDPVVCSSTGAELMPSLNGAWTLSGGERTIWGSTEDGSITMQIPPQEPASLVFEYLPERGLMHVTSPDGENEMFMFPATDAQVEAAQPLIDGGEADMARPGCDWYDSPLFIGTNYYLGYQEVTADDAGQWLPGCGFLAMAVSSFDPEWCRIPPTPGQSEFEMDMTLVVRFSGPDQASGMLYFEGTGENTELGAGGPAQTSSEFRARAEVELSR